eukprot:CCRYP_010252-RD/>CCRYP_010252-RD protein AED:0.34 eAED:0.34 QI:0/0/0/1/0/0/2/0/450
MLHHHPSDSQHNGWQKDQIEKRRTEQLRQRKEMAKKKPLGEGIRVDTSIQPCDYTKTGLKLKLDQPQTKQTLKDKNIVSLSSRLRAQSETSGNKLSGTRPLNSTLQSQDANSSREDNLVDVNLLDDGTTVNDPQQHLLSIQTQAVEGELKEQLKDLSLSSTANPSQNAQRNASKGTSKRNSFILRLGGQTCGPKKKFQSDEGKENCDKSVDPSVQYSRTTKHKKSTGPKKHFQRSTDINSLKREHADAIKMLQEMDREENRRRSLDSEVASCSFDSDELYEKREVNTDYNAQEASRNTESLSNREEDYDEFVSSGEIGDSSSHVAGAEAKTDESFAWLPDGIKDASHLSIVLREDIESQDESESTYDSELFRRNAANPSDPNQGFESDEHSEECCDASASINTSYDAESSSHSDDYLSDSLPFHERLVNFDEGIFETIWPKLYVRLLVKY